MPTAKKPATAKAAAPKKVKPTSSTTKPKKTLVPAAKKAKAQSEIKSKDQVVVVLVYHILDNASYVMRASSSPHHLMLDHLKTVSNVQSGIQSKNIGYISPKMWSVMGGGDASTVLPSEYFGRDSHRYFDINDVARLETQMFANTALARAALPSTFGVQGGGGSAEENAALSKQVSNAIKSYQRAKGVQFTVDPAAKSLIQTSVQLNLKK